MKVYPLCIFYFICSSGVWGVLIYDRYSLVGVSLKKRGLSFNYGTLRDGSLITSMGMGMYLSGQKER